MAFRACTHVLLRIPGSEQGEDGSQVPRRLKARHAIVHFCLRSQFYFVLTVYCQSGSVYYAMLLCTAVMYAVSNFHRPKRLPTVQSQQMVSKKPKQLHNPVLVIITPRTFHINLPDTNILHLDSFDQLRSSLLPLRNRFPQRSHVVHER